MRDRERRHAPGLGNSSAGAPRPGRSARGCASSSGMAPNRPPARTPIASDEPLAVALSLRPRSAVRSVRAVALDVELRGVLPGARLHVRDQRVEVGHRLGRRPRRCGRQARDPRASAALPCIDLRRRTAAHDRIPEVEPQTRQQRTRFRQQRARRRSRHRGAQRCAAAARSLDADRTAAHQLVEDRRALRTSRRRRRHRPPTLTISVARLQSRRARRSESGCDVSPTTGFSAGMPATNRTQYATTANRKFGKLDRRAARARAARRLAAVGARQARSSSTGPSRSSSSLHVPAERNRGERILGAVPAVRGSAADARSRSRTAARGCRRGAPSRNGHTRARRPADRLRREAPARN